MKLPTLVLVPSTLQHPMNLVPSQATYFLTLCPDPPFTAPLWSHPFSLPPFLSPAPLSTLTHWCLCSVFLGSWIPVSLLRDGCVTCPWQPGYILTQGLWRHTSGHYLRWKGFSEGVFLGFLQMLMIALILHQRLASPPCFFQSRL